MITVRKSDERGRASYGWLEAKYSFSFANYFDPKFMGFSDLRVINQDVIDEGMGFGPHPHRNMEIVSYIISGALEHKDSEGNGGVIQQGEIQRMTAGKGIRHSEYNPSKTEKTKMLQIWIETQQKNLTPSYKTMNIAGNFQSQKMPLIVSPDGREGTLDINQDVFIHAGKFNSDDQEKLQLSPDRNVWVQMISGQITVNNQELKSGDGAAISKTTEIDIKAAEDSEFLLFNLR